MKMPAGTLSLVGGGDGGCGESSAVRRLSMLMQSNPAGIVGSPVFASSSIPMSSTCLLAG